MPMDCHRNLFTHESIKESWHEAPEMLRLIKWWKMQNRVQGKTVAGFVAMVDEAGRDKVTGWPRSEEMISLAWKREDGYLGIDARKWKYLSLRKCNS